MTKDQNERIAMYANNMRKDALKMALAAGGHAAHFGAGFSCIDLLATLYSEFMYLPKTEDSDWDDRDRFIMSKGHGVLGYYAALVEKGMIPREYMSLFENSNSYLLGHPVQDVKHGIEFTNGSLGMGLSIAVGVGLAAKRKNKSYHTYVLMGDGECAEGSVWEAALSAAHFDIAQLTVLVDKNSYQLGGLTKDIMNTDSLADKFRSFGWNVEEIDGHDYEQIYAALDKSYDNMKPKAIIADTIKGKGFSFSENNNAWHHAVLTDKQYELALQELEGDR